MRVPALSRHRWQCAVLMPLALLPLACDSGGGSSDSEPITLYTCVSDESVQPIIEQFEADSGTEVKLFRAPTGDLNARIAGDVRSGGLKADVVWACDPLTMQGYVDQDLVGGWTPDNASDIPQQFRTDDYVGAAVLYVVAIYHNGEPVPSSWSDLAGPDYESVALPDPTVCQSTLYSSWLTYSIPTSCLSANSGHVAIHAESWLGNGNYWDHAPGRRDFMTPWIARG